MHLSNPTPSSSRRSPRIKRQQDAARLSLYSNIFLVTLKLAAGIASGAISVLAEGVQSLMDVLASLMILWTIKGAASPPDEDHPYGHGKMESMASLAQIVLICGSAFYILAAAWRRWNAPEIPRLDWGIGALSIAIVVNFFVSRHLKVVARETNSPAIAAEAVHLQSDLISCAGVVLGLIAVWLTQEARLDPLIAAVMALVVIGSSIKLGRDSVRPLLDESLPDEEIEQILKVLRSDKRVLGYHRLRTRQAGSQRLMDVHIQLDDDLSFLEAHAIAEEIEESIRKVLPNLDVIVHAEPYEEEMRLQQEKFEREKQQQKSEEKEKKSS